MQNQKLQKELLLIKNKNIKLESNEINKNRKLYLNLKNLFNKTEKNNSKINKNIFDGINNLIKEIDKIKKINEEIQLNINSKNIEKKKYNFYYIYWEKLLNVTKNEDIKKRIHELIN